MKIVGNEVGEATVKVAQVADDEGVCRVVVPG